MLVGAGVLPSGANVMFCVAVVVPSVIDTSQLVGVTLVKVAVYVSLLPCWSYPVIEVVIGVVLVLSAGRLPPMVTDVVGRGASSVPTGSRTLPTVVLVSILPVVSALQPCTTPPCGSTSRPLASKENEPARVYSCSPPLR